MGFGFWVKAKTTLLEVPILIHKYIVQLRIIVPPFSGKNAFASATWLPLRLRENQLLF
jgi:hypothetical protein